MKDFLRITFFLWVFIGFAKAQSFDPALAAKLQNNIDNIRAANNIKGISACVIHPAMGTWKGVTGISHAGSPIASGQLFGIASNTKLFTGVLLLKLAEHKFITLDDSLHTHLPSFKHIDPNITIRQLLNHRSGLADVNDVPGYPDSILNNPKRVYTPAELMTWLGPPLFPAGTSWGYCNTNYLLAGMIAERATGKSYGQLLRDSILSPLQLDSTFLDVHDSILYTVAHPWQAGVDHNSIPRTALNSASWAAGGMYSCAAEMAQWYQALMSGRVLNARSLQEMTTFVGSGNYGIGISRATVMGRTVWQHGGAIWGGYSSFMLYDTATGIVICVLINQLPAQAFQIATLLLSTIINHPVSALEHPNDEVCCTLYPNPTSDMLNIDVPHQKLQGISVFSQTGQLLKTSPETRFSISELPAGMYLIEVQTEKRRYWHRVVK